MLRRWNLRNAAHANVLPCNDENQINVETQEEVFNDVNECLLPTNHQNYEVIKEFSCVSVKIGYLK